MLSAPATVRASAPPPAPPAFAPQALDPTAPPLPSVVGANAEPYSATLQQAGEPPPQPAWPPPEPCADPAQGPAAELEPPPLAVSVPAIDIEPSLRKPHEPMQLIVEPDPTVKTEPAYHELPVVLAVDVRKESAVLAEMETLVTDGIVLPENDSIEPLREKLVGKFRVDDDTVSELKTALLAATPRVLVVAERVATMLCIVRCTTPARTPDHVKTIDDSVVVGGSQKVEPDTTLSEVMRGRLALTGALESEQRNGREGCIVTASLVLEATYAPDARTVSTLVAAAAREPAASQLEKPHKTR